MANTTLERAEEKIEEKVVRYRELTDKRRVLREQIEKAEAQKRSVKDRVYQRVLGDYRRRLEDVEGELGPVAADVQAARTAIQSEIREIDIRAEEVQDKLEEIAFRHRVGEYDASAASRMQGPLSDEYERLVHRRRALSELLNRVDGRESERSARDEDRAAESTDPCAAAESPEAFVDPKDWVGEFIASEPRALENPARSEESAAALARGAADSLSELADPSEDASSPECADSSQPVGRRIEHSDTLPILAIVSGPAAGKRVPLLPMTMTLGREVDNNIEIKDIDVARYHARISFEGGQYVIQELEGSSGTFVDGQRITKAVISPGSSIRVGNTELRLELP